MVSYKTITMPWDGLQEALNNHARDNWIVQFVTRSKRYSPVGAVSHVYEVIMERDVVYDRASSDPLHQLETHPGHAGKPIDRKKWF